MGRTLFAGSSSLPERAVELWDRLLATLDSIHPDEFEAELKTVQWIWSSRRNADFIMTWVASTARYLDPTLNPLSLQDKWVPAWRPDLRPYNGRGLADKLGRWDDGKQVWIGTTSPDPMNTGIYLSKMSLFHAFGLENSADPNAAVDALKDRDRTFIRLIQGFAYYTPDQALRYLTACMILAKDAWTVRNDVEDFAGTARPFYDLIRMCEDVLSTYSEAGRWGEAFVAAALEASGATEVVTKGAQISKYFAGDVTARLANGADITAEVRQKFEPSGPMAMGASLGEKRREREEGKRVIGSNLQSGLYVELPPVPSRRRSQEELREVREQTGTFVISLRGVFDVISTLLATAAVTELDFASRFPALFDKYLHEQNVAGLAAWRALFDG